jgi:hypothetical protein
LAEEPVFDKEPPQGALLRPPLDDTQKVYVMRLGGYYDREPGIIESRIAGGLIPNWFPDSKHQIGWAFDNYFHALAYQLKLKTMKGK